MCLTTPRAECELQVSHAAPARARRFLRIAACPEHHSALLDDAMVLVSELVTNSVLHGGPPLVVAVECDGTLLQVRVRDGSSALPIPQAAGQSDENGRGLAMVAAMSDDWGVEPDAAGKQVWFVLHGGTPTRLP
jgi:anti-sigma regulatory factor (Ser/Thr protein kinase)